MPIHARLPRAALAVTCAALALCATANAHPGSGIAVDRQGQVYFIDTAHGVWKVDTRGRLVSQGGSAFHWMAIDRDGRFAQTRLPTGSGWVLEKLGSAPTLILASDFPVVVGRDGALYYPEANGDGRVQVIRLTATGVRSVFATLPATTRTGPLRWLNGLAAGPDGSIYFTDDKAVRKISPRGELTTIAEQVTVPGCIRIPGNEPESGPLLRGLDVAADGTVYVAASGCGAVLKITAGAVSVVLRTTSPWSPTAVAVAGRDVYVLEYIHTATETRNSRREWLPRVRRVSADGTVTLVATVERE